MHIWGAAGTLRFFEPGWELAQRLQSHTDFTKYKLSLKAFEFIVSGPL
jgi:hypothetical protein